MDIGEKLIVLENLIYNFATTQFALNEATPTQAKIVLEGVYSKFQEQCLNHILMSRVTLQQAGEAAKGVERTGTVEDLMEDFSKAGFTPAPDAGKEEKK